MPWSNILGWSSRSFTSLGGSKTKVSCRSRAFRSAFVLVVVVVIVVVVVVVLFLLVLLLLLLVVKSGLGTGATLPFASWPASLLCCCQLADVEAVLLVIQFCFDHFWIPPPCPKVSRSSPSKDKTRTCTASFRQFQCHPNNLGNEGQFSLGIATNQQI